MNLQVLRAGGAHERPVVCGAGQGAGRAGEGPGGGLDLSRARVCELHAVQGPLVAQNVRGKKNCSLLCVTLSL